MFSENFRQVKMGAIFHVTTSDEITGEVAETCSTKNIILDVAYEFLAGSAARPIDADIIHVGSSSVEPTASQTGLLEQITAAPGTFTRDLVNPLKWYYDVYFSSDQANGPSGTSSEIREVGASWFNGVFLNRALLRDQDMTPRTITKSPSQVLTIRMEFEIQRAV
jgi:hypothetical protein